MRARRQSVSAALAAACLFTALAAGAANTPVFRHALERWPASDYELVVFHRGELGSEEQAVVDKLRVARGQMSANVEARVVDVAGQMEESMADLWICQTNPMPPWLVVCAPDTSADAAPVWAGHLTEAAQAALLDSPARRKIVESLTQGATAVWVLLECGEASRDEAAVDMLAAELKRLEKKLPLPKPAPGDAKLRSPLPLAVEFALVRVTRTDPAEEFLVTLLQHGKQLFAARPAAFPIYGRGRVLGALVGREIEATAIEEACASLVAACAREGKEQNPGRDLLLAANWDSIFAPGAAKGRNAALAVPVPATRGTDGSPAAQPAPDPNRWMIYAAFAGGLAVVAGVWAGRKRRRE